MTDSSPRRIRRALAADIPVDVTVPLLEYVIDNAVGQREHQHLFRILWARLNAVDRRKTMARLGTVLDREVPAGIWAPRIQITYAGRSLAHRS